LIEEFQNAPRRPPGVDRGFDGLERFGQPSPRWIVSETAIETQVQSELERLKECLAKIK